MLEFLSSISLFSSLTTEQLTRLSAAVVTLKFTGVEHIVRQGEKADAIYLIREGKARPSSSSCVVVVRRRRASSPSSSSCVVVVVVLLLLVLTRPPPQIWQVDAEIFRGFQAAKRPESARYKPLC